MAGLRAEGLKGRPCGAGDPAERSEAGEPAKWGRQRKPCSAVACLRLRPLSVPPLLPHCLRAALPLLAWPKAAVALRASLPACGGAALGRAAAAPAFRPPPFASALAAAFSFPFYSPWAQRVLPDPLKDVLCMLSVLQISSSFFPFILFPGNIRGLTLLYIRCEAIGSPSR